MMPEADAELDLLRHTVATLAYRGGKTLRGAPNDFATFRVNDETRTARALKGIVGKRLTYRRPNSARAVS